VSKLEPEVEFRHYGGVVSNSTLGAYSTTDQDIFTKFVVLAENGVPERVNGPTMSPSNTQDSKWQPSFIS